MLLAALDYDQMIHCPREAAELSIKRTRRFLWRQRQFQFRHAMGFALKMFFGGEFQLFAPLAIHDDHRRLRLIVLLQISRRRGRSFAREGEPDLALVEKRG